MSQFDLSSLATWGEIYLVGGLGWAAHHLTLWRHEPPVERPLWARKGVFVTAQVLALMIIFPFWPIEMAAQGVLYLIKRRWPHPIDDEDKKEGEE